MNADMILNMMFNSTTKQEVEVETMQQNMKSGILNRKL